VLPYKEKYISYPWKRKKTWRLDSKFYSMLIFFSLINVTEQRRARRIIAKIGLKKGEKVANNFKKNNCFIMFLNKIL